MIKEHYEAGFISPFCASLFDYLLLVVMIAACAGFSDVSKDIISSDMVRIRGGTFEMGDLFGEGQENERLVHRVTLSAFYLRKYEVTVARFRLLVEQTGYRTSAEGLCRQDEAGRKLSPE